MCDHLDQQPDKAAVPPGKPDESARNALEQMSGADCRMCWTCGTCDLECPLNIATGRLRPQKMNRLAYLGWIDELLGLPQIWYCLQCRKCNTICPNKVKPSDLVEYARIEACRKGVVSNAAVTRYKSFYALFQRVRWHAAVACLHGELEKFSADCWEMWLSTPVEPAYALVVLDRQPGKKKKGRNEFSDCNPAACYTCSECSGACPIFCERSVFDPQAIVRMATFGMIDELLNSASIWLCLGCGRCEDTCSQRVSAKQVIERIRRIAREEGFVDREFPLRLERAERLIYPYYINDVDRIFGFASGDGAGASS